MASTTVFLDEQLAKYGFGAGHPFSRKRFQAFSHVFYQHGLDQKVQIEMGRQAEDEEIQRFHTPQYIDYIKQKSIIGRGYIDYGDTPAFKGIFESAAYIAGTTLEAVTAIMDGYTDCAFVPIAGLHHARRNGASGFCVFNDGGIAVEMLREKYFLNKIAYINIDAHHGDGIYYGFDEDPDLICVDTHQENIFPGSGLAEQTGEKQAIGTKLNLLLKAGTHDQEFAPIIKKILAYLDQFDFEFMIFQCGADNMKGDPLCELSLTEESYRTITQELLRVADQKCQGRFLALGGGGSDLVNLAKAWNTVVDAMIHHERDR